MTRIAGRKPILRWAMNLAVLALGLLWALPVLGLLVTSFRTSDEVAASGWWQAAFPTRQTLVQRIKGADAQRQEGQVFVIEGDLVNPERGDRVTAWGFSSRSRDILAPGASARLGNGGLITIDAAGHYRLEKDTAFTDNRGPYVFVTITAPPMFTLDNYRAVLSSVRPGADAPGASVARAFFDTLSITIPATVLPLAIATMAAYALAWMRFRGRLLLFAAMVGLMAVPVQMALIPLLEMHARIGIGKSYLALWLAHTGLSLPFAIYILRGQMAGLSPQLVENARVDGASEVQVFTRIVLPLIWPGVAAFGVLQFLWTWNDLLLARVFLIDPAGPADVLTNRLVGLMGARGDDWETLAAATMVSIALPLAIWFGLRPVVTRGMLLARGKQR